MRNKLIPASLVLVLTFVFTTVLAPVAMACNDHDKKILVCHIPPGNPDNAHEIKVNKHALKAHLKHGDYEGKCIVEPPEPQEPKTFARGALTALTQDGKQKAVARMAVGTGIFVQVAVNCKAWEQCVLRVSRSEDAPAYELDGTFDYGTLGDEKCNTKGVCTQKSKFTLPADPDPTDPGALSLILSFFDASFTSGGEATLMFSPDADKVMVEGSVAVFTTEGAAMTTIGSAEASVESKAKTVNFAMATEGAVNALSQSSMSAADNSDVFSKSRAVAKGANSVAVTGDDVRAVDNAVIEHKIKSRGVGENKLASCSITADSNGDSLATLDALSREAKKTDDKVDHTETLNDPAATADVSATCGDINF